MRTSALATLILVTTAALAVPAWAEERSDRFLRLMTYLPDTVIANRSSQLPEFVDYEAASGVVAAMVAGGEKELSAEARRSLSGPLSKAPEGQDWTPKVGFARSDLGAAAGTDDPEKRGMVLLLSSEALPRVGPALLANGYAQSAERGFPAYWRGVDDLGFDPALRSPDDPFTFPLPVSSRMALDGDLLLQSPTWPMLEAMVATSETSPSLLALAHVLDLPDWGDRKLIQATVFSDPSAFAPAFTIASDLTLTDAPNGGVPYWSNLMLADLGGATSDVTLIVLLYAARSDAEAAAKAMDAGLGGLVLPSFGDATLESRIGIGRAMVSGEGPYAAVYAVESPPDVRSPTLVRNRGYHTLLTAAISRELSLLGPSIP